MTISSRVRWTEQYISVNLEIQKWKRLDDDKDSTL